MTAKEALNNIATISEILVEVSKSHIMSNKAINEIRKLGIGEIYFTLRQALTPPTQEEVCEALSEYFGGMKIKYIKATHKFYFIYAIQPKKSIDINKLPPHLITLIGRFYEGLEKVGKEDV